MGREIATSSSSSSICKGLHTKKKNKRGKKKMETGIVAAIQCDCWRFSCCHIHMSMATYWVLSNYAPHKQMQRVLAVHRPSPYKLLCLHPPGNHSARLLCPRGWPGASMRHDNDEDDKAWSGLGRPGQFSSARLSSRLSTLNSVSICTHTHAN